MKQLNDFYKQWADKHNGDISAVAGKNIYLIETEDRDGNITGRAYAKNITLNRCFISCFVDSGSGNPGLGKALYIGSNGNPPSLTDTGVRTPITNISATMNSKWSGGENDKSIDISYQYFYNYLCYCEHSTGRIYATRPAARGYFDYVLKDSSGTVIPGTQTIREISLNNMTLALVLDDQGYPSYIEKHENEKLTITAYVSCELKLAYVTDKFKNQYGAVFSMHPAAFMLGSRRYNSSTYPDNYYTHEGRLGSVSVDYINSLALYNNKSVKSMDGYSIADADWNLFATTSAVYDSETNIIKDTKVPAGDNWLIENTRAHYDMIQLVGIASFSYADRNYCGIMSITKPMEMDSTEVVESEYIYCDNEDTNDVTTCLGKFYFGQTYTLDDRSSITIYDACQCRSNLPVVQLTITDAKSYNGLTHDWDIPVSYVNNTDWRLSMYVMWGNTVVRLWLSFLPKDNNKVITVWHNNFSTVPITKIHNASNITWYYSSNDNWWDPTTWVAIVDPENITQSEGTHIFYMTIGGAISRSYDNEVSQAPVWLDRNINPPRLIFDDTLPPVTHFDEKLQSATIGTTDHAIGNSGSITRSTYACESRNYIAFTNTIYYPEDDVVYHLQNSYSALTNNRSDVFPSMRYTEKTGKRMLQVFATLPNNNAMYRPYLQKVSVFEISDNSAVAPVETVIDLGSTFPNDYTATNNQTKYIDITSTETGYVIFMNRTTNRIHIVDMMGDASNSYTPNTYILSDEDDTPYTATGAWAIKYTDQVIFRDYDYPNNWKFKIYDLKLKQVVKEIAFDDVADMTSPKTIDWVLGWKNLIYFQIRKTSNYNSYETWLYNSTEDTLVDTLWNNYMSAAVGQFQYIDTSSNENTSYRTMHQCFNAKIFGDESCLIIPHCTGNYGNDNQYRNGVQLKYIDEDHALEPIDLLPDRTPLVWIRADDKKPGGHPSEISIGTFNQGKQKILSVSWYTDTGDTNKRALMFIDLNYAVDHEGLVKGTNALDLEFRNNLSSSNNNYFPNYGVAFYKDKAYVVAYKNDGDLNEGTLKVVDPNRLIQHKVTGTTTTVQVHNNPKRLYGIKNFWMSVINNADVFSPDDMPPGE